MGLPNSALGAAPVNRPDIFGYESYKVFLRDYIYYLKLTEPDFSIRKLALKAQVSLGYISNILNTPQDVSDRTLEKLIPHLNLSPSEISYLRNLVTLALSSSNEERVDVLKKIQRFKKYSKLNPDETLVFNYLSRWYYVAIREMANMPGFQVNPKWIQEQLNFAVPLSEVSKALEFLIQNKLIRFEANGSVTSSGEHVHCQGDLYRFILTHFHKQIFELAAQAIDNTEREKRNIVGHTLSLTEEEFAQAKKVMDDALDAVRKIGETARAGTQRTYHFTFLGFPLSKPVGDTHE